MPVIAPPPRRARKVSNGPIFDIGNMSYDGVFFAATNETTAGYQVQFSPDGTHMVIMGGNSVGSPFMNIWEYALSPAWDITSATLSSSFNSLLVDTSATALAFSPDGTRMYIVKQSFQQIIRQYALSPAWDVSTAVLGDGIVISDETSNPQSIVFKDDGTVLYLMSAFGSKVYQYDLSPAWDITSAAVNGFMSSNAAGDAAQYGLAVVQNGEKIFTSGIQTNKIFQFSTSTPYDVTNGTYDSKSFDFTEWEGTPRGIFFKPDATKVYMIGQNADTVFQYSLN